MSMVAVGIGTVGLGLAKGIAGTIRAKQSNKALADLLSKDPTYTANPYAAQQFGQAQHAYNGRMAGAASEEANIGKTQANTVAGASRGATDSSQLLAVGANAQGQADNAYNQLGTQEAQNKYSLLDNLNRAYGAMINEGDKVAQDKQRKFGVQAQIGGQIQQNRTNATNGVFNGITEGISNAAQLYSIKNGMSSGLGTTTTDTSMDEYNKMLGYRQSLGRQRTIMPN